MSHFRFGSRSMAVLLAVKAPLRALAIRALELSPVDFAVIQGNRTLDQQKRLYGQGRTPAQCAAKGVPAHYSNLTLPKVTWTLNSDHIGGNAIDVMPWVNGKGDWDNDGKKGYWPHIAAAFKHAAQEQGFPLDWGGDWTKTKDRPHFARKG